MTTETAAKREISRADIMDLADYGKVRKARRDEVNALKKNRRVEVGPFVTFYFESYETMWHQIHEMLWIEKGGEEQIAGELDAYNPLVPKGNELVATVMVEIDNPQRRARELAGLGGFEETMTITVGGETIRGKPEEDVDRTNAQGKASSVQFVHFPFTPAQIEAFKKPGAEVVLAISHPKYGHSARFPEEVRDALSRDFD